MKLFLTPSIAETMQLLENKTDADVIIIKPAISWIEVLALATTNAPRIPAISDRMKRMKVVMPWFSKSNKLNL